MKRSGSILRSASGVRLLLLDEHALFCAGMVELFRAAEGIGEVAAATDVERGVQLAERFAPDVVSIAPQLNGTGPVEAARRVRACCPAAKLMFLDDSVRWFHVRAALEAGAAGYWTKRHRFEEIVTAVGRLAEGRTAFCPTVERYLASTGGSVRFLPASGGALLARLTARELQVLVSLAQGLTVKQCARQMQLARSTVDNHKSRLMKKLGVHKAVDLAVLAVREGLLD